MLRVTVDAFSGRLNPSWILNERETGDVLKDISRNRGMVADVAAGFTGLGFRGVVLEPLSDDVGQGLDLPAVFKVGRGSSDDARGLELAERLIQSMRQHEASDPAAEGLQPFDEALEAQLLKLLDLPLPQTSATQLDGPAPVISAPGDVTCMIERGKFNPGFWNDPSVIGRNNCYNYASNWRTNTFAQPGRGAGQMYTSLTCAEVTRAALADGCHRRFDCFPDAEKPRWLMALVVGPRYDYHWYRQQVEGFWGHKPGGTAARNTDNSGNVIANPETCNRGPYTDFCGYFYGCNTQRSRMR